MAPPVVYSPDAYVQTNNQQQQAYCEQFNREAAARYTLGMSNYNGFIDAVGKLPPYPVPTPENAWGLTPPDANGLQWQIVTSSPVCDIIPVHPVVINQSAVAQIPNHIAIGSETNTPGWFTVLPGDGVASGKTVPGTSADGVSGMFEKFSAVVGNGWYLKVA